MHHSESGCNARDIRFRAEVSTQSTGLVDIERKVAQIEGHGITLHGGPSLSQIDADQVVFVFAALEEQLSVVDQDW